MAPVDPDAYGEPAGPYIHKFEEEIGARKRVFIPGYSGVIHRMQDTMAGTFATCSRNSHYLAYKGNHPAMQRATLSNPDEYYARKPNPRYKTNCNNRSTFTFGDDRDWNFDTIHQLHYRVPVKIPPRHESIMPGGKGAQECSKELLDKAYVNSLGKVGVAGVKRLELSIRAKIDQRTSGGPMALRKAFKYFDTDASGDIDPDEFFAAMHAFGLEFTEDQVLALFGYYDVDRDGGLSYYEFIDKVMDSGFGNEAGPKQMMTHNRIQEEEVVEAKSVLRPEDLNFERAKASFKKFDANNSGEIDMRELGLLVKALGLNMGQDGINAAMIDLDKDQNGAISFDEFWSWFENAAVVTFGRSSASPSVRGTSTLKIKSQMFKEFDKANKEYFDAQDNEVEQTVSRPNRPSTAASSRGGKVGGWVSRVDKAGMSPSPAPTRIRPQTAMERRDSGGGSRSTYAGTKKAWDAKSWRSVSRSDFRPPSAAKLLPPKLNLPARRGNRPMSAQPLIRTPGAPAHPVGSTSGFRL